MGLLSGVIVQNMKDNSKSITLKDLDTTFGLMGDSIRDHGKIIKCMEEESLFGLTEEDMKESTLMIRNRVMDSSFGQMAEATKVLGKMESKMDVGHIEINKDCRNREHGSTGKR